MLIPEIGTGSDSRRKNHLRRRLSGPALFLEIRTLVRENQMEVTNSFIEEITNGLQSEFDQLLLDIQCVVSEEGEVSESRQYPEAARRIQDLVNDLVQGLEERNVVVNNLRE
jgi:hypothetical protein